MFFTPYFTHFSGDFQGFLHIFPAIFGQNYTFFQVKVEKTWENHEKWSKKRDFFHEKISLGRKNNPRGRVI